MISLKGARVIVVDDDRSEAIPILHAFARKGIPAAFFDGTIGALPTKKYRLSGVRLAILDMDLIGGGVPDKSKAAHLVNYLGKILSVDNGPYAVLIWTKHQELRELFENYLQAAGNIPRPLFSVMITKRECKNKKGNFNLRVLSTRIEESLAEVSPLLFLQSWEEKCFTSATEVTNTLASLAAENAGDFTTWRNNWKSRLLELMHAMAEAEAEKNLDCDSCLSGLYASLNPLHADRMESQCAELSISLGKYATEILQASADCGVPRKARVNTMLHLAFDKLDKFHPGNLYKVAGKRKPKLILSKNQLIDDLAQLQKDSNKTPEENARIIADTKNELASESTHVLIETSAACDHAQRNIRVARFIAGLLVPISKCKKMKRKTNFIWEFGPLSLNQPTAEKGQYYLFLSARHVETLNLNQAMNLKAIARLRSQALTDLQAWFNQHSNRPGVMLLR